MLVAAQVREALKVRIEPLAGMREHVVFDRSAVPDELVGHWVVVNLGDELIEQFTQGNPATGAKQAHTLDVNIDILFVDRVEPMQQAEEILARIVPAVFTDRTLGGLVKLTTALGTRREKNLDGQPVARIRLQCQTVFHTFDRDPTTSV